MTETTLIRLTLQISEPWAVGTVSGSDSEIDLPIETDPREGAVTPTVPMTALAGSLRRHLTEPDAWLGPEPTAFEVKRDAAQIPSRLWLLGAILDPGAASTSPIASRGRTKVDPDRGAAYGGSLELLDGPDQARVDPDRGAAYGGSLRTEQWVEPTMVDVLFEHAGRHDEVLLADLASWTPVIGRGRSVGMGQAQVLQGEAFTLDLSDERHLHWWLGQRAAWVAEEAEPPADCGLRQIEGAGAAGSVEAPVFARLRVREPVHLGVSKGETTKAGAPIPILRSGADAVVPGSSWKGVFRHRVRLILECVGADLASADIIDDALFGSMAAGRGRLRFGTSRLVGAVTVTRTHVAIDRFTGGARDGALFAVEAVAEGTPIDLCIAWSEGVMPASVSTLLRHVVRDLHEGLLRVGGHGSRGYGHLEVTDSTLDGLGAVSVEQLLEDVCPTEETK